MELGKRGGKGGEKRGGKKEKPPHLILMDHKIAMSVKEEKEKEEEKFVANEKNAAAQTKPLRKKQNVLFLNKD